ncbi:sensor histidine kinase [Allomuricauda sp. SCSIO 65647]|uniref:sensor histidine kinase n=1 Tax=Allomuricauda sp. SCSIO 65647 TaxID=2908843 RepID=UPI001F388765|nr:ATP-binding protein [Muricauda sp. SCSIO 65647]UJH69173.1 ATP-binding protein [Muricauda sp. SCSIO 65647]
MASRNFYLQLIVRVLLIALTAIGLSFALVRQYYLLMGVLVLFFVLQTYFLISYINSTNRKIAYFFDAIKNEDFTLRFPEKVSIKSFKELNQSLNRVNGLIQEVHLQLQIRERYYQEIMRQANIGIMTFNKKGHILFSNPTLENLLNYKPLNHIKQLNQIDGRLYGIFASMEPFDRKLVQLTNEREQIQLALKSTPLQLDGQDLLLVVVQDIHRELDEKETDSWVRLIRVLTHEIMNTITPITSISESILKYFGNHGRLVSADELNEDKIRNTVKGLKVISQQGSDLMEFVQSYRSFLNVPKPDRILVRTKKLFDKVEVLTQRNSNDLIEISWISSPEDLELFIDEKQITQVLVNLVKNAIHSLEDSEKGKIQIRAFEDKSGKKYIEVSDDGPGIPQEIIEDIFVPFFTTKDKGTGIGLSLSKQIMHLHGGNIKVHSELGNTSFLLSF